MSSVVVFGSLVFLCACTLPYVNEYQDPLTPEEHLKLGMSYEEEGQFKAAIREYKAASEEVPEAYYYLGNVYFQRGQYDQAEDNYKAAIKEMPTDPRSYNNLAWLYCARKRNLLEAERLILRALKLVKDEDSKPYRDTLHRIRVLQRKESASAGGGEQKMGRL
jgi:tetratricopeptide (TPR) repeat protein